MHTQKINPYYIIAGVGLVFLWPQISEMLRQSKENTYERQERQRNNRNRSEVIIERRNSQGKIIDRRRKTINLEQLSREIYDAFYNSDYFGITEDETKAIAAIKNVPKSLIPRLSAIYQTAYNKILANDFRKFLSNSQYAKVSPLFT